MVVFEVINFFICKQFERRNKQRNQLSKIINVLYITIIVDGRSRTNQD
jgi:hypothetical protein